MILPNDRSVSDDGFWRLMIDQENRWSIMIMEQTGTVLSGFANINILLIGT